MQRIHKTIDTNSRRFCSVPQCSSYSTKDISLHKFPLNEPKLCKQWQQKLKIGKAITKYMSVCSKHFLQSDFFFGNYSNVVTHRRRLKKGVVPSQNLPVSLVENTCKKEAKLRRCKWIDGNQRTDEPKDESNKNTSVHVVTCSNSETHNRNNSSLVIESSFKEEVKQEPSVCIPGPEASQNLRSYNFTEDEATQTHCTSFELHQFYREQKMEFKEDYKFGVCGYGIQLHSNLLQYKRQHNRKLPGYLNVFTCHSNIGEIYKCEDCDFETNLKVSLIHHLNLKHKNLENEEQFRNVLRHCGYCNFQTYSILFLLKHCFQCDESDEIFEVINWLECVQCSYKTKGRINLRRHIMRMHSTNLTLDTANIAWHLCDICDYRTKWKGNLKQHSKIHDSAEVVWYYCDKCKFKSKWKDSWKSHIATMHTDSANIVWYHCDICEHKTKRKDKLKRHIANLHSDSAKVVLYHCDKCKYKTKMKENLKRHIENIHTDSSKIVWYHCDRCKHKTKRKADLKRHIANMHLDSAYIVWYHCNKCTYKTKRKDNLQKHIATVHIDFANIV